ncbi:MAG: diaminohydroxyphosphoribosylaminopyrimidine deaminase [Acidimicrobiaceae bacterium]|jgi:diaminohydroxyphosphoribosylaminopyrimidine deaminase/5-amino-6-(5-phosphoribosylamino)uracil reductase|nr:diaminohydroxyphosphoribosylaminopyrimidine deaminase [Acidimicrobiaceae bacterium]MDQ1398125.1 diaminohydroxyphosphoribosylaminopyrimidine deaminase [Acidimicrobiaceae bacterium]MDQ1412467.1 diaminohydroxyphosphoribosylaminopyrimidine deaminase [Acidimicrobiaceae bacterium]MDQ1416274.1 diaminohydroxyphosphoribosylaminopyrimidine deaminase [Acidimicrobiaceae bacterium]MDQ1419224.1 diaminohydroxyphosphoribosylaminopyrimidine deaminase [Acidimicrobiaceae bacterium]
MGLPVEWLVNHVGGSVVQAVDVEEDRAMMLEAISAAATVRSQTAPNPWVGCVIVPSGDEPAALGATQPPGGLHAEAMALDLAGPTAAGAVAYVTLEPCCHHGRTPPCADALIAAGVRRVVIGVVDPDPQVRGQGIEHLRAAGIEVSVGVCAEEISEQLAPYLKQRSTGRPWVVLKLAASLDGRTAAPDGTSQWITGPLARADAHRLRAESDAVLVGAGTVRADDPALTVRDSEGRDPLRVVLGHIPDGARVQPALELGGDLGQVLDELGQRDVVQLLVEGGATVAHDFHRAGLVDRYVLYLAPVLFGGDDGRAVFAGSGAASMADVWRGRMVSVEQLGPDVRIELAPTGAGGAQTPGSSLTTGSARSGLAAA